MQKYIKWGHEGVTSPTSRERVTLETSNSALGLIRSGSNEKYAKLCRKGS